MSVTLVLALVLQLMIVVALRHRLGQTWLRRPTALLILASVVYQGVSPLLLSVPSIAYWDGYRIGVQQPYVDQATLMMSTAMLGFTTCYLLTRPERLMAIPQPGDIPVAAKVLDWRLVALACAPLAVLTYEGRGAEGARQLEKSLSTNLAVTFFVALVILAAFALVLRHGQRWFLPALITQSVLLAAAGERTPVVTGAITLIVLLTASGLRPPARQLQAAAVLTVVLVLAITGTRAQEGRVFYHRNTGLVARVTALGRGLTALAGANGGQGILAQAAIRLDGVDFGGALVQAKALGDPRLSAAEIPDSLMLAVPSVLWPSKLGRGLALNPTVMEMNHDGLQQVNFLPGLPGMYLGFLSWPWLVILLAGLGFLAGQGELRLMRRFSPARLVMLAGSLMAALAFEQGLPGMLVTLRTAVVIAVAAKAAEAVLTRKSLPHTHAPVPAAKLSPF